MNRGTLGVMAILGFCLIGTSAMRVLAESPTVPDTATAALSLTAQQQQKLSALQTVSRTQVDQLTGQIRQLRAKIAGLYGSYGLDAGEARRLNQQLNHVQSLLLDQRLSEQQQLRGILSADQFTQLQAAIQRQDHWDGRRRDGHDPGDPPGRGDRTHDPRH